MSAYAHSHPDFPRDFSRWEPLFTPDCPALAGGECAACEAMDPHHGHLNKVAYWAGKFAEEMFHTSIPEGSLFYGTRQRRTAVVFDEALRATTETTARRLHELITSRITPAAEYSKRCESCSLERLCLPKAMRFKTGTARWFERQMESTNER